MIKEYIIKWQMKKWTFILTVVLSGCAGDGIRRDRFFLQGNNALSEKQYDQAVQYYSRALAIDPDFERAYNNRGVAYIEDDHPYEAIRDYNMAVSLDSQYYEAIFNRAYAYEQVGRLEDALLDIRTVRRVFPDSAYVYFYEGLLETRLRDYDQAIRSFEKALQMEPDNEEGKINLATLYFFQSKSDTAKTILKGVLRNNLQQPNALNTLSQIYLQEGDYQNALITINQALKIAPKEPYFINNRGQVYLEMNELKMALDDINKSILLDPENAWAYRNKGIYYLKSGKPEEAIRLLKQALESREFVDEVYTYLGEAYWQKGEQATACEMWKLGVERKEPQALERMSGRCRAESPHQSL